MSDFWLLITLGKLMYIFLKVVVDKLYQSSACERLLKIPAMHKRNKHKNRNT